MKSINIPKLFTFLFISLLFSCSKTEENVPLGQETAEITVEKLVRKASLRNQEIPFTVINETGNDVTENVTFYVNGEAIEGSIFSSAIVGDFEVYGVYEENGIEITTNTEPFSVIIPKRKVVVEDYTGTWCGYCPRVAAAIEDLRIETNDIAVVAIHETANSNPDPMHFDQVDDLQQEFGVAGLPAARINRTTTWQQPHATSDVTGMTGVETNTAIAVNSELTGNNLIVKVNVVYENGSTPNDKLVVYLVEDGIVHPQTNYFDGDSDSPYYQQGNPIEDFVHNDVLRTSLSNIFGDEIPSTSALIEYGKTYNYSIPEDYNINNLKLIVMVVNEDNTAINAQFADLGQDKAYE